MTHLGSIFYFAIKNNVHKFHFAMNEHLIVDIIAYMYRQLILLDSIEIFLKILVKKYASFTYFECMTCTHTSPNARGRGKKLQIWYRAITKKLIKRLLFRDSISDIAYKSNREALPLPSSCSWHFSNFKLYCDIDNFHVFQFRVKN